MTLQSRYLLPTLRDAPADAEALSHQLMTRAGLVRQVGAGLWTWLPAGWRVHRQIEQVIREEINAIGGLELLMPVLQPAEPWQKTGRYGIDELFKLEDRRGAEMVLAMTHEEIITTHAATLFRSYRDLPKILYHFQVKERDEPRPRAGIMRTREFVMKDSYSFDRDREGLDVAYEQHALAYQRIFDRAGLQWYRCAADVGMMGGHGSDEYMAPCAAGENEVVIAGSYAANLEVAVADARAVALPAAAAAPEAVPTPGRKTIEQVAGALSVDPGALLKSFPIVLEDDGSLVLVLVRGDHSVNEIKLRSALGQSFRQAKPEEFESVIGPAGSIGPVGASVRILLDRAVSIGEGGYVVGANQADTHLRHVVPGRDFSFESVDARNVVVGDSVAGVPVRIEPAIEIGNIFKLGVRYSEVLGANFLDADGGSKPIWMGSYGIGPARVAAAAVEQLADEKGICWPPEIAPFDVHLVTLGKEGTPEREVSDLLYTELGALGLDTLYDERDAGPGEKFADAELLGCPVRVTVGRKALKDEAVEVQIRRGREMSNVPLAGAASAIAEIWRGLP